MSLAMKYAMKRKSKKMAKGGTVAAMETGHMIKGVNKPPPAARTGGTSYAGLAIRQGNPEDAKEFHKAVGREKRDYVDGPTSGKSGFAEGGEYTGPHGVKGAGTSEDRNKMSGKSGLVRGTTQANINSKGVNEQDYSAGQTGGQSVAGRMVRTAEYSHPGKSWNVHGGYDAAKDIHKETLSEMKSTPGPTSGKSGFAEGGMCPHGGPDMCEGGCYAEGGDVKGVHTNIYSGKPQYEERSDAGEHALRAGYAKDEGRMADSRLHTNLAKEQHRNHLEDLKAMPGPTTGKSGFAEGGAVDSDFWKKRRGQETGINKPAYAMDSPYSQGTSKAGHEFNMHKPHASYAEHKKTLEEMKSTPGPTTGKSGFAHGGHVSHEDMVDRIMHKYMSRGGEVANEDEPTADFEENSFDDLANRDGLEFAYTGANSGDELGDTDPDEEENDRVARIMMKRRKQSNPRPA